jgi:hypothetical protein
MNITTVKELMQSLREGPFTSVGSYPKYYITADGETLAFKTVKEELGQIARAIRDKNNDQWRVIAANVNWEDTELYCSHTTDRIESAYAEKEN